MRVGADIGTVDPALDGVAVHPAAAAFPDLDPREFEALVEDIRHHGLLNHIVLHDGTVLDGRHRPRVCREAAVQPRFVEWNGEGGSPTQFVLSQNLHRRHLSAGQRAMVAASLLPLLEQEARERQGRRNDLATSRQDFRDVGGGDARDIAGKACQVSGRYVSEAKALLTDAPDLAQEVTAGAKSLPEATREMCERRGIAGKAAMFTSETDDWPTPQAFFDRLNEEFEFTLDPCASAANAKTAAYFTSGEGGLSQDWSGQSVFMNPPYGREIGEWIAKAHVSAREGGPLVVALIPARCDTAWWHDCVMAAEELRFVRGRLRFGDETNSAPFPSVVVMWGAAGTQGPPITMGMRARGNESKV